MNDRLDELREAADDERRHGILRPPPLLMAWAADEIEDARKSSRFAFKIGAYLGLVLASLAYTVLAWIGVGVGVLK